MSNNDLFSEFSEVSAKQWKQKIQVDLKGADYNETLIWESLEGIKVKPFYHAEDLNGLATFAQPKDRDWKISQHVYVGNAQKANSKALNCLKKGAETLLFTVNDEQIDFSELLLNIDLERVPVDFDFQFLNIEAIKRLLDFLDGKKAQIKLNIDIIGNLARTGNWFHDMTSDHDLLKKIHLLSSGKESVGAISIDTSLYQNAGANMVQQLAYGLAHANEYLNHLSNDTSSSRANLLPITFKVSVSGNYFFEIAKLRALRWLWKSLATQYKIENECRIFAFPSRRNKTLYDYNVNMLRTTSECMSAVLGGADTVLNLPYDALYHKDNEFAERIARNQLLLLKEESYFDGASNASKGSYYIESLTRQLADKALELFKQIESSGGLLKELKKGTIQRKIKESSVKEEQLFEASETVLVGSNKYQNPQDSMKGNLELHPFVKNQPRKTLIEPIIEKRLAETLEQKRLKDE